MTRRTMRWIPSAMLAAIVAMPGAVRAQSSAGYTLEEHTLNNGGRPLDAIVSTSPSFRISLDAIGGSMVRGGLSGVSYRMDGGFAVSYPPPGEVEGLQMLADRQTLTWIASPASSVFNVYSGPISTLPGTFGGCAASRVAGTSWADPTVPAPGTGLFYLVTGENRLGEEGTKGRTSTGAERGNPTPCP
jgi:hypothetical protein